MGSGLKKGRGKAGRAGSSVIGGRFQSGSEGLNRRRTEVRT